MKRSELKVGQIITIGMEVEFWNSDDSNVDYRTDRWTKWEVKSIEDLGTDYVTAELECKDGIWSDSIELDIDYDDIELA